MPDPLGWKNGVWQGKQIGGFLIGEAIVCHVCATVEEREAARFRTESILLDSYGYKVGKNRFLYACARCGLVIAIDREVQGRAPMTLEEHSAHTQRLMGSPIPGAANGLAKRRLNNH